MPPAARAVDLPSAVTSFVGRRLEVSALVGALDSHRLVTVVGPGGVGKTRLTLQAVAAISHRYDGGVRMIELSGLRDPDLLPGALAARLGLPDQRAPMDAIIDFLRDTRSLIILDTCEHLIGACGALADEVLSRTGWACVLATSRQPLNTPGEHVFALEPLPITAGGGDALELFEQRASAVVPGFTVEAANRQQVVDICSCLDGIPLAIELAAVRLRTVPLDRLAANLGKRLKVLTGSRHSRVERHRTLRMAIEWSHELCTEQERLLWRRLSVFAGGFDLDSAEEVCKSEELTGDDVLESLAGLVERCIVRRVGDDRYRMLDTIREFGAEQLEAAGDLVRMRDLHLARFTALAVEYGEHTFAADQLPRTRRLRVDHENLQVALEHAVTKPDRARATALSGGLWCYWHLVGRPAEGCTWQTRVLDLLPPEPSKERSWTLNIRAHLSMFCGHSREGVRDAHEAAEIGRVLGDPWLEGRGQLYILMGSDFLGDFETAIRASEITTRLLEAHDNYAGLGLFYGVRGNLMLHIGKLDEAIADCRRTREQLDPAERWMNSYAYLISGMAQFLQGRMEEATESARLAMRMKHDLEDPVGTAYGLEVLAWISAAQDRFERASWLLGAADMLWRRASERLSGQVVLESLHQRAMKAIQAGMDEGRHQEAWRAGAAHPLELTIASAEHDSDRLLRKVSAPAISALTQREYEVAVLAAQGLSNREISEKLVISKRTVDAHMDHILTKLDVSRRAYIRDVLELARPD